MSQPTSTLAFDFTGQVVIHTGSGQGIGRATAAFFASRGAKVIAVDVDEAALRELAAEHPSITPLVGDVSDPTTAERALEAAGERVDVLINNAGILRDRVHWKLSDDEWNAVIGVHLTGTFNFVRACSPLMRGQGYGRIVNTTSYAGLRGNFGQVNYSAAKAGIIGLTKAAAKELASFGVTVNAISPNAQTAMIDSIPEPRREEIRNEVPMKRFSTVDEVVPVIAFLASAESAYVTGVVVPVDGGISI